MNAAEYETSLKTRFPSIPWREALQVQTFDGTSSHLVCRICIARYGLRGEDMADWPLTQTDFQKHLDWFHPT